jgi:tRNA 2-selenouridine synthase
MIQEILIGDFLASDIPLIDVRSPGEFIRGHIPGAVNIPLFSDAERAHVGLVFTRNSSEKAIEVGYRYVKPKLDDFILQAMLAAPDGEVAVHCWRGGMRSRAFAKHLDENGFSEVSVITGGYKAYRNYVLNFFDSPFILNIIGGYTGSGKTEIIRNLQEKGHQVVDLEGVAHHKGSSFGALGQMEQPSIEQFENNLFDSFKRMDISLPIWLEDESHNIGGVTIPMNLYRQMLAGKVFFMDIPGEVRTKYLVDEYAGYDPELLAQAIGRISKRLGGQNTKAALQYLDDRNFYELTMLILHYYDKSYLKGLRFHDPEHVYKIQSGSINPVENANSILKLYEQHQQYKTDSV